MEDDQLLRVPLEDAEALFRLGADDDVGSIENVDVEVILNDGSRWSATFLSAAEIARIMKRREATGEHLVRPYLHVPDLIVVSRSGLDGMVAALNSILASGDPATALVRVDIEE